MENAYVRPTRDCLKHFGVTERDGLSDVQVQIATERYGRNGKSHNFLFYPTLVLIPHSALPEDPPTPLWQLVLEQFKDQLVIILLGSAAVSFVLALFEDGDDWTAFVDPVVVSSCSGTGFTVDAHQPHRSSPF